MEEKLEIVQSFLTKIEEETDAQQRFEELANAGDVAGFEQWALESGCDLDVLRSLAAPEERELSDDDLDQVAGGAGFFASGGFSGRLTSLGPSPRVAGLRTMARRIGSRYPSLRPDGLPQIGKR